LPKQPDPPKNVQYILKKGGGFASLWRVLPTVENSEASSGFLELGKKKKKNHIIPATSG
jgi:hypothetical protein